MKHLLLLLVMLCTFASYGQNFSNKKLGKILKKHALEIEGTDGGWELLLDRRPILVAADQEADRIRIFTFVAKLEEVNNDELEKLLRANFNSAVDAKYAVHNGLVMSLYSHPLDDLTELQIADALQQVNNLAENFRTSYSSTELPFQFDAFTQVDKRRVNVKPRKPGVNKN